MKRPDFRSFAREDFPDAPWIEKLIRPLNTVLGAVASGLGNGLTLGENLNAEVKVLDITTRNVAANTSLVVSARRSVEQTGLVSGVSTTILFDVEDADTHGAYDPASGTFTAPSAGYFLIAATAGLGGGLAASGELYASIFVNGVEARRGGREPYTAVKQGVDVSAIVPLSAGDAVTIRLYQSSGSNRYTDTAAGSAHLSITQLDHSAPSAEANPAFPVRFTTKVKGKVAGVLILRCVELSGRNELPVNAAIGVPGWEQSGESVSLNSVAGLAGGRTYRLTLAILGG